MTDTSIASWHAQDAARLGTSFSGIEGFAAGFTLAGWRLEWTGEIDKHASQVLAARFPGAPNTGDITRLAPERLRDVDCYAFGFPCQDLSVAGHRAGLTGARSGLFWEALRVIAAKRPRWIVAENVPGLLTSNQRQDFGVVLWALACLGYGVAYAVLDAQHFGVPQRRRRVFIVGCLGDAERARQVLADAPGGYRHPPAGEEAGRQVAGRVEDRLASPLHYSHDYSHERIYEGRRGVSPAVTVGKGPDSDGRLHDAASVAGSLTATEDCSKRGTPSVFHAKQTPVSGERAGALTGEGRQGVLNPRGHPPGPTHLHRRGHGGSPADDGRRQSEHGTPPASVDAVGDGAPPGVPRWLDLPMWGDDGGARALCLDREATHAHRREESRQTSHGAGWIPVAGGGGSVAGEPRETVEDVDDEHGAGQPRGRCSCPDTPRYRETGNAVAVPVAYWLAQRIRSVEDGGCLMPVPKGADA